MASDGASKHTKPTDKTELEPAHEIDPHVDIAQALAQEDQSPEVHASDMSLRAIIIQTIVITIIIVAAVALLAKVAYEPFQSFAMSAIKVFGLPGVLFGLWLTDTFTFPIPTDTYLVVAVASKRPLLSTMALISLVSVIAGNCAYFVGPWLTKVPFIKDRIEGFRPRGERLFGRWGVGAVAIGALTPLPYSVICWFAGIYKMPYRRFALSTLFRIPRMVGYYLLIADQWIA